MNEFNAVSTEELKQIEGGSFLDTFVDVALAVGTISSPLARIAADAIANKITN